MTFKKIGSLMILTVAFMLTGCATDKNNAVGTEADSVETVASLAGSKWHYTDKQWQYDIEFADNGVLHCKKPNDKTPDNDSWEQDRETVRFYYNNKFSQYQGVLSGRNLMSGTAKNIRGNTWEWSATRVE
jgi:hypothetical protein